MLIGRYLASNAMAVGILPMLKIQIGERAVRIGPERDMRPRQAAKAALAIISNLPEQIK